MPPGRDTQRNIHGHTRTSSPIQHEHKLTYAHSALILISTIAKTISNGAYVSKVKHKHTGANLPTAGDSSKHAHRLHTQILDVSSESRHHAT